MKFVNRFFLLFISVFFMQKAYTQSIPVGTVGDDYFRILNYKVKLTQSILILPDLIS